MAPRKPSRGKAPASTSDASPDPPRPVAQAELPQVPPEAHFPSSDSRNGVPAASSSADEPRDGSKRLGHRHRKGLLGRRRSQSHNDLAPSPSSSDSRDARPRHAAIGDEAPQSGSISLRPGGSVRLLPRRKGSVPAVFSSSPYEDGGLEELKVDGNVSGEGSSRSAGTSGAFPTLRRVGSKVFGNPFASSSSTSLATSPVSPSPHPSPSLGSVASPLPSTSNERRTPPKRLSSNNSDFQQIAVSDADSFEDDGKEGSLQDAMEGVSDSPLEDAVPDGQQRPSRRERRRSRRERRKAKVKEARPGKQHGAGFYPSSPRTKESKSHRKQLSIDTTPQPRSPVVPAQALDPATTDDYPNSAGPSQGPSGSDRPSSLTSTAPATGLQTRLSGWISHAFSASANHLPLPAVATTALETGASVLLPRDRTQTSSSGSGSRFRRAPDLVSRDSFLGSRRDRDKPSSPVSAPSSAEPSSASSSRRGPPAPNGAATARSLGNFLDKAVNYLFDTDAHAYDQRITDDIWMMGGQQFEGKWDWEGPSETLSEDWTSTAASTAGSGNETAGSSGVRRLGRRANRNKALFRNRRAGSDTSGSFRGIDSSSPSPSPSNDLPLPRRASEISVGSLPATLTNHYPPPFYVAFASIVGLTYRTGFPPIPCSPERLRGNGLTGMLSTIGMSIGRAGRRADLPARSPSPVPAPIADDVHGLTTDQGWGCMLRTGQSLLANALLAAHLGTGWRRPLASIADPASEVPVDPSYARLLSWFIDTPSLLAPFSVHRFAAKGQELGKEVGEWFGPSTAAGAIKSLTNNFAPAGLGVVTDVDGTVYGSDVLSASVKMSRHRHHHHHHERHWQRPVLILVNLRLGIDGVHPSYHDSIKAIFALSQSVGIAGGRPSSSYYFFGSQGASLFYIDPHHPRPAIALRDAPPALVEPALTSPLSKDREWEHIGPPALDSYFATAYPDSALRTFHTDRVRRMPLSGLDPSMLVGFLVKHASDWEDLCTRLRSMKPALVHIADSAPAWMKQSSPPAGSISDPLETSDSDLGVDSLSEADDEAESELERSETARDLSSRHVSTATVRDVSQ